MPPYKPTTGYYLRPGTRAGAPGVLWTVVTHPTAVPSSRKEDVTVKGWGKAHVCLAFRRKRGWGPVREWHCDEPAELFTIMERNSPTGRRNYVVAPNVSEALTYLDWFSEAASAGIVWAPPSGGAKQKRKTTPRDGVTRVRRCVMKGRPDILDYSVRGKRWIWCSGHQYFPETEEELASDLKYYWDETHWLQSSTGGYVRQPGERARLWMRLFQRLADWWLETSKAPWALTAGGLAKGMLRTHAYKPFASTHNDQFLHKLEREGCFGARSSTWYFGDVGSPMEYTTHNEPAPPPSRHGSIPGPLHQLDVRSMYPAILAAELFPARRYSYRVDVTARDVWDLLPIYAQLVDCTIETDVAEYPCRVGGRIVYPTGRFRTILTGPELVRLRREGSIKKVWRQGLYHTGTPFDRAALAMIDQRERAEARNDPIWARFAKLVANSMAGKLAQRRSTWVEAPRVAPRQDWGEWTESGARGAKGTRYRALARLVWKKVDDPTGAGEYTAAFSYLTAYGRVQMRSFRECCPAESVISQDTDGLWVTGPGRIALERYTNLYTGRAGQLRYCREVPAARFYAPRHYWVPLKWTLAGFADPVIDPAKGLITHTETLSPLTWSPDAPPTVTYTKRKVSEFAPELHGVQLDHFGWAHPVRKG